ncbi:MAG TPA: G1 family glutamic endopeptidase [Acidimicrobiales bacterium]|nr:G1 family glutamic endopeptidase [Acidimicrobiales bacterium]
MTGGPSRSRLWPGGIGLRVTGLALVLASSALALCAAGAATASGGALVAAPLTPAAGRGNVDNGELASTSAGSLDQVAQGGTQPATSTNWSGYVAMNGPYRAVTGTFTVPTITRYIAGSSISEWVGIDGYDNRSLIQAGVNEIPEGQGQSVIEPWWEVLPFSQKLAPGVMVRAGQTVTVTLHQQSDHEWSISLVDDNNGDSFSTDQDYAGLLSSADWVVEANAQDNGTPTTLAPFRQVSFSKLEVAGAPARLTCVAMVQNGRTVGAPSALTSRGFTVVDPLSSPYGGPGEPVSTATSTCPTGDA